MFLSFYQAKAQVTSLVNYQGKLQQSGTNVNGTINVMFSVFTDPTNSNNLVYQETQQVNVVNGLYSTLIGQNPTVGTIQAACKMNNTYLEVAVNGNTLSPRELFCPPPFAQSCETRWYLTSPGTCDLYSHVFTANFYYTMTALNLDFLPATNNYSQTYGGSQVNIPSRYWGTNAVGIPMCVFAAPAKSVNIDTANILITNPAYNPINSILVASNLVIHLTARTFPNGVRTVGPDLVLTPANLPAYNTWTPLPLSTNSTDLIIQPGEFLCVEFIAPSYPVFTGGNGVAEYMSFDIEVR